MVPAPDPPTNAIAPVASVDLANEYYGLGGRMTRDA
jgi:hypothetical protein